MSLNNVDGCSPFMYVQYNIRPMTVQLEMPGIKCDRCLFGRKFSDPELQVSRNEDEWANIKQE